MPPLSLVQSCFFTFLTQAFSKPTKIDDEYDSDANDHTETSLHEISTRKYLDVTHEQILAIRDEFTTQLKILLPEHKNKEAPLIIHS